MDKIVWLAYLKCFNAFVSIGLGRSVTAAVIEACDNIANGEAGWHCYVPGTFEECFRGVNSFGRAANVKLKNEERSRDVAATTN